MLAYRCNVAQIANTPGRLVWFPVGRGCSLHFLGKGFIRLTCASLGVFERVAYAEVEQVLFVTGNGDPVTIGLT